MAAMTSQQLAALLNGSFGALGLPQQGNVASGTINPGKDQSRLPSGWPWQQSAAGAIDAAVPPGLSPTMPPSISAYSGGPSIDGREIDAIPLGSPAAGVPYAAPPVPRPPFGMLSAGNIDVGHRPVVQNADGTISTVRSMSFGEDGREVLVPTVSPDGRLLSDDDAINLYRTTGENLGTFNSPDAATMFARNLHDGQEAQYSAGQAPSTAPMPNNDVTAQMQANPLFGLGNGGLLGLLTGRKPEQDADGGLLALLSGLSRPGNRNPSGAPTPAPRPSPSQRYDMTNRASAEAAIRNSANPEKNAIRAGLAARFGFD